MAAKFLNDAGIKYEKLLAEENKELVEKFAITEAPTLIVIKNGQTEKIANPSNIRSFCDR